MALAALRTAILVVVLLAWQLGVKAGTIDPFFWGEPAGIWQQLVDWVTVGTPQGSLGAQILVTLEEAVIGFIIGSVLGIVFGIALGRIRILSELFAPFLKAANSIPRIILGSIFTVAFGFGIQSKIVLAVVLVFFGVFFNAFQGSREVDRNLVANARLLGASRWQVTRDVVLPSAFTWILASLHISFGFALIGALVGRDPRLQPGTGPADSLVPEQLQHERRDRRHGDRRRDRAERRRADHSPGEPPAAVAAAAAARDRRHRVTPDTTFFPCAPAPSSKERP